MKEPFKTYWPLLLVPTIALLIIASSGDTPNESDPQEQSYASGVWSWSLATAEASVVPSPQPGPQPGGICENCNGRGKVGDGTVMVTCAVCNGTGRHPGGDDDGAAPEEAEELPPDDPDEPEQEPQQQAVYTYGSCSDGSCGVSRGGRVGFFRRVFGRR